MGLINRLVLLLLLSFTLGYNTCLAGWTGPAEVVSGSWGTTPGQFAISYQDTQDIFPTTIAISSTGRIAITEDQTLKRVQIFNSGAFERIIDTFAFDLVYGSNDDLFVSGGGFRKYDSAGKLQWTKTDVSFDGLFSTVDGIIIGYDNDKKTYYLYSSTGQLIKTSTMRPLELGAVSERPISGTQYKITLKYPDKNYELLTSNTFMRYVRDMKGYVYGVNDDSLWKFNQCGKQVGELLMPEEQTETVTSKTGKSLALPVQYGQPIVGPNGDVYTWKKSMQKYSIVKWTWVDDPNVPTGPEPPTNLSLTLSINGLYLTWQASPNDPGCVTKYEIARATTSGGVFSTIDTVEKGVLKYNDITAETGPTYYYKVRAMAGSDPSLYTAEVSGKR